MFDAAFLEQCAAPGIKIEIVERFLAAVGAENPLAISITSGNRVILPEPPKSAEEAARLAQRFVVQAVVRRGDLGDRQPQPAGRLVDPLRDSLYSPFDIGKSRGQTLLQLLAGICERHTARRAVDEFGAKPVF